MRRLPLLLLTSVLLFTSCASTGLTLKQRATVGLQASETALEDAHNLERSLCFVNPAVESGGHCTNPQAATVKLTDAVHQKLAGMFSQAFDVEIKATQALIAYKAGDPVPKLVVDYQTDIQAILAQSKVSIPSAAPFIAKVQVAVDSGAAVLKAFGVQ